MNKVLNLKGFLLIALATVVTISMIISLPVTIPKVKAPVLPIPVSVPKHKNCDCNELPHIVYEIFVVYFDGKRDCLKYGISCLPEYLTKAGYPRPELQKNYFQKQPQYANGMVQYIILYKDVPGRMAAKAIEQNLVNIHFVKNKRMPLEQKHPTPDEEYQINY